MSEQKDTREPTEKVFLGDVASTALVKSLYKRGFEISTVNIKDDRDYIQVIASPAAWEIYDRIIKTAKFRAIRSVFMRSLPSDVETIDDLLKQCSWADNFKDRIRRNYQHSEMVDLDPDRAKEAPGDILRPDELPAILDNLINAELDAR